MKIFANNKILKNNQGFTLVEIMVAMGLFTVIVVMGIQSIIAVNKVHQKNQDQRAIIDSVSYAMEDIARNLSVATMINCGATNISQYGDSNYIATLATLNADGDCVGKLLISFLPFSATATNSTRSAYAIIGGACSMIYKSTEEVGGQSIFVPITSQEICIDRSKSGFLVRGADTTDKIQPLTTIRLAGYILYHDLKTPFNLETSVSQRFVDSN